MSDADAENVYARNILANNIVYYRLQKGWSQEDFADKLGTTPTYKKGAILHPYHYP